MAFAIAEFTKPQLKVLFEGTADQLYQVEQKQLAFHGLVSLLEEKYKETVLPLSKSVFAFLKSHPSPSILICMNRINAIHDFMRL
jgi:hypothetical protein